MPLTRRTRCSTSTGTLQPLLPQVTQPLLMLCSTEDHVVDPGSHRKVIESVSSLDVTEKMLPNSYHVATLDNDAPPIFEESADFVARGDARAAPGVTRPARVPSRNHCPRRRTLVP